MINVIEVVNTYINQIWLRYTDFRGRTSRKEYWYVILAHAVVLLTLGFIGAALRLKDFPVYVYHLAVLVPTLAITIRRLHDVNLPWFWIFISIIPFIGALILLLFMCLPTAVNDSRSTASAYYEPTDHSRINDTYPNQNSSHSKR